MKSLVRTTLLVLGLATAASAMADGHPHHERRGYGDRGWHDAPGRSYYDGDRHSHGWHDDRRWREPYYWHHEHRPCCGYAAYYAPPVVPYYVPPPVPYYGRPVITIGIPPIVIPLH